MNSQDYLKCLNKTLDNCRGCCLSLQNNQTYANKSVPGFGSSTAKIVFIGEAPGKVEDQEGLPFVGPAGIVLQQLILDVGLTIQDVYLTNILKHRPPNNRDPQTDEATACTSRYLNYELKVIRPKVIVCIGRIPTKILHGNQNKVLPVGSLQGIRFNWLDIQCITTWHPAYYLRNKKPNIYQNMIDDITWAKNYANTSS